MTKQRDDLTAAMEAAADAAATGRAWGYQSDVRHLVVLAREVERLREEMRGMAKLNYRGKLPPARYTDTPAERDAEG